MYGFQNEDFLKTLNGAVAQIGEINRIADKVSDLGYKNIYLVGTGGTYAIISPLAYMLKTNSTLVWYHEIAAELLAAKPRPEILSLLRPPYQEPPRKPLRRQSMPEAWEPQ